MDAYARSGATVKLLNNKITDNSGPGIIAGGSGSLTIFRNMIVNNTGATATGIFVGGGSPQILSNLIENNHPTTSGYGGGITIDGGSTESSRTTPRIMATTIRGNSSRSGGGIRLTNWIGKADQSDATLISNCVIADNEATALSGGGISAIEAFGSVKIANTVFRSNEAYSQGGAAFLQAYPARSHVHSARAR